ncbi:hypothetical protein VTN00DRAFT_425 [Thermoascus crustaceus]|uniref:uncharacterized protein n=1 Tax=Thermoascus crustaceus TaxID=5088 RepID=UPI0037441B08
MEHMRLVLASSASQELLCDLDFSFINPQHNITCIPGSLQLNCFYSVWIYILKPPCPPRALFTLQLIYSSPGPFVLGYLFVFMLNGLQTQRSHKPAILKLEFSADMCMCVWERKGRYPYPILIMTYVVEIFANMSTRPFFFLYRLCRGGETSSYDSGVVARGVYCV